MSETMEREAPAADDLSAIIGAAWDDLETNSPADGATDRDERGRFAAREGEQTESDKPEDKAPEQAAQPAIEAPASWSDAEKAHWNALPPDAQQAVIRRERDVEKALRDRADYEPVTKVLEPYRAQWEARGVKPDQVVASYLEAEKRLATNFDAALPDLIRMFGRDPVAVARSMLGASSQAAPAGSGAVEFRDPRVDTIYAELQQQKQVIAAAETRQREEAERAVLSEIQSFAKDHPHFETVRKDMSWMMQADEKMTLKDAYDRAVWANPATRDKVAAQALVTPRAKVEQPARASSIRDNPGHGSSRQHKVDRSGWNAADFLNEAWDQLEST